MPVDRFSITMDPELGKAVREAAAEEGISVSSWLAEAAMAKVRNRLLRSALDAWEAEDGPITEQEYAQADAIIAVAERRGRGAVA